MPATLRWLMDGSATEPLSAPVARDTGGTAESDCMAGDDSFEESLAVAMRGGLPSHIVSKYPTKVFGTRGRPG